MNLNDGTFNTSPIKENKWNACWKMTLPRPRPKKLVRLVSSCFCRFCFASSNLSPNLFFPSLCAEIIAREKSERAERKRRFQGGRLTYTVFKEILSKTVRFSLTFVIITPACVFHTALLTYTTLLFFAGTCKRVFQYCYQFV